MAPHLRSFLYDMRAGPPVSAEISLLITRELRRLDISHINAI